MNQKGLSIVELMTALAIVIIVITFAIPSYFSLQQRLESDSVRHDWLTFLKAGRRASIDLMSDITACPVIENTCVDDLTQQWLLFTDDNRNKVLDSDEQIIQSITPRENHTFAIYREDQPFIRFYYKPQGMFTGMLKSFVICPTGSPDKHASLITINIMGRVEVKQKRNAEGIPLRFSNNRWEAVSC